VPRSADVEVVGLRKFVSVKIAKIAVPNDIKTSVQKAPLHDQGLVAINDLLINYLIGGFDCQIVGGKSGGGEHHLTRFKFLDSPTITESDANSGEGGSSLFLGVRRCERLNAVSEIERGFSTGVGIFDSKFERLPSLYGIINFCNAGSNPSSARCNQTFAGNRNGVSHGIRLFVGGVSLFGRRIRELSVRFDEQPGLLSAGFHFGQLPAKKISLVKDSNSSQNNKQESEVISKPLASIFSALLFAISLLLLAIGVNKSRDSKYAALYVFVAWPIAAGRIFFGVLGWHSLAPLIVGPKILSLKGLL
jgi:hypothetical protein